MTEILFYHLQNQPLERVLPTLLEKSLERGWRVVVQAASEERIEALDAHLWTFRDDSFLPHGTHKQPEAAEQPILLTVNDDNPNKAEVRFLIDNAPVPDDASPYAADRAAVRRRRRGCGRRRAHALERGEGKGTGRHLLAAGCTGTLGEKGLIPAVFQRLRRCGVNAMHNGSIPSARLPAAMMVTKKSSG